MTNRLIAGLITAATALALAAPASAVTVTRGPYLQTPTPSSMIVRWRTDVPTDSEVLYGSAVGALTSSVSDPSPTTEHIVTLGSLAPDTQYFYAVGSAGGALVGDTADHFLRTTPVAGPARPTRIWVTGDGGFANANGQAVRDAYAAYNSGATDLWLLLGDNAYVLATDADYQAALFNMHHDMLLHVPVWSTFGNHEDFSSDSITQTGPYFDLFSFPTGGQSGGVPSGSEAYYSFDFANIHFIVLDSEGPNGPYPGLPGRPLPGDPMMIWLTADLQANTQDWTIVLFHRAMYSKGLLHDSDTEQGEINMHANVLPLLESYGVDLILNGHSHDYERSYLLDGHYGHSSTLTAANKLDSGDGDPAGDGAYRKTTPGSAAHEGEVVAVCGSSSEVRNTTLNHPAHVVGRLELGSMVIDVAGNTLTGRFLNSAVNVTDQFQIVKGPACPAAPQSGCTSAPKGKIQIKNHPTDDTKDKVTWKWQGGTISSGQVGSPLAEADLAVCFYDATGRLLGNAFPKSALLWKLTGSGALQYKDKPGTYGGLQKAKIAFTKPQISVLGKGAGLGVPLLPATTPVTAQLLQLDNGSCWESVFTTFKKNDSAQFSAKLP